MGNIFGKGNNTTTTNQSANPTAQGYYGSAWNTAQNVAGTPTSAVPLQGVANLNASQQAGIGQTNQYSQFGIPYIQQALALQSGAANPLTGQQIGNYYNPYQQQVIQATENQFNNQNAQQQQQVLGNSAAQGALGNDRTAVAQANLAAQQQIAQAPVIAGLEQQGYNQALQTAAQQYQQNPEQAAFGIASSGVAGQNAGLQGAQALFGAGNVGQQYGPNGQAYLNALYGQQLGQFQLPFQESQLLTQNAASLGPLYGGTSSTTAPPPSALGQLGGLLTSGVGAIGGTGGFGAGGWLTGLLAGLKTGGAVKPKTFPENHATLSAQQDQLVHGHRAAQMFPHGTKELERPRGMSRTETDNGVFHYNPHLTNGKHIRHVSDEGRENEVLGLGSLSKKDVFSHLAHGGVPVSIVERRPDGTEVRAAAGTSHTAHAQMAEMRGGLEHGNSLHIEDPRETIHRRGYDAGGVAGLDSTDITGLGNFSLPQGRSLMPAPPKPPDPNQNLKPVTDALGALRWNNNNNGWNNSGATSKGTLGGTSGGLGGLYKKGGRIKRDDGGALPGSPGYVPSFEDRWGGVNDNPHINYNPAPQESPPDFYLNENETRGLGLGQPVSWNDQAPDATDVASRSPVTQHYHDGDDSALPIHSSPTAGGPLDINVSPATPATKYPGTWDAGGAGWLGVLNAGLGMLASRSPFPGVAIGEGGMQGVKTFAEFQQQQRQQQLAESQINARARELALETERLQKQYTTMTPYQQQEIALRQRQQHIAELQPVTVTDPQTGMPHTMARDPDTGQLRPIDPMTGQLMGRPNSFQQPNQSPVQPANPLLQGRSGAQNVSWQVDPGLEYLVADEGPKAGTNPEVLQGLDPGLAARVRAVDEGRMPLPTGAAQRMPQNIALLELLSRYDPNFTAQDYATKLATRRDFTSGPTAKNITALNTVMQHVGTLDAAASNLNNWHSSSWFPGTQAANSATLALRKGQQDPRIDSFNTAADAVATELERAFRGNTTALGGIQEWRSHLNPAMSPEQWQAARQQLMHLLGGRLEAVTDQYNRGMGSAKDPIQMLSPAAAKQYKALLGGPQAQGQSGAGTQQPTTQRPSTVPPGSLHSPSTGYWKTPDGRILDPNGNPVQ